MIYIALRSVTANQHELQNSLNSSDIHLSSERPWVFEYKYVQCNVMQSAMLAEKPRTIPTHKTPMQVVHALRRILPPVDMRLHDTISPALVEDIAIIYGAMHTSSLFNAPHQL